MKPVALLLLLLTATWGWAQNGPQPKVELPQGKPPALSKVSIDQRLNEQVPLDVPFRDEAGRNVVLGDYFSDKPVILVLSQYRCPMLCTQVLNGLLDAVRKITFDAGDKFQIVVVSFDAREMPGLAAAKKESYVESYGRPGTAGGWHFLTGQQSSIDRLTAAVGFRYIYDQKTDQFAHASGIMIVTPKGRLARYFYGIQYSPRDLRLGLVESSEERIGAPVDQIMLFCFHYDARTGKYSAAVVNFVRAGAILTVLALGSFMFYSWRRGRSNTQPVEAAHVG